nr:ISAs1 family transposase [Ferrovum sp.]
MGFHFPVQTNEIGMFTALLDAIEIKGKLVTADALLTQRRLAVYLVQRGAHYHFTAKGNQTKQKSDIALLFEGRAVPALVEVSPPDHGRIETRRIWCSEALKDYLDFPHVGQVFLIEREVFHKKSGKQSLEIAVGLISQSKAQASAEQVLAANRGHWTIENRCHYVIDWNFDEDRSRIRTGYGPENVTRLRRFAVGVLTLFSDGKTSIAEKMSRLNRNTRLVFDYLRMTKNSTRQVAA